MTFKQLTRANVFDTVRPMRTFILAALVSLTACGGVPAPIQTTADETPIVVAASRPVVPASSLPYASRTPLPLGGDGIMDIHGVRMFLLNGKLWNHPTLQAQYALRNLDAYRLTHNVRYLARARSNALRIATLRVESSGAWFYPFRFSFAVHGDAALNLRAPWYSALSQGQALSVFVKLYGVTGNAAWLRAADKTFASFAVAPAAGRPWVTWTDADGHLWLEEYPRWPVADSERVLNGPMFSAFGMYDYAVATGNVEAWRLFDGAVETAESLLNLYRQPGGAARYSLRHNFPAAHYQSVVVAEFVCLGILTGHSIDGQYAQMLHDDYPATLGKPEFVACPVPVIS